MFKDLSGIELNQEGPTDHSVVNTWISTTFKIPGNYSRGNNRLPDITGFEFCHDILSADTFTVDMFLEVFVNATWVEIGRVNQDTGVAVIGPKVWNDVYFDTPIPIAKVWYDTNTDFRINVRSNAPTWVTVSGLRFRLLTGTADADEDFLGNKYRAVVVRNAVANIVTGPKHAYWLSKPNPSKFAIESLYFDMRTSVKSPAVIDRILIDPITPGVLFHVYYSDGGGIGSSDSEWEDRLWTPVTQTFRATRREEHALPAPITAKFLKIEFCHLQAQHYSPGTFHQPLSYKKHPKWVLDYFLAKTYQEALTNDPYVARRVGVTFDAFELAYDYSLDDLKQDPRSPEAISPELAVSNFLQDRSDVSDQIDPATLSRIKLSLKPFTQNPGKLGNAVSYLPAVYTESNIDTNYPIEQVIPSVADTTQVSNVNRTPLVIEQNYPSMFFYLTARHKYREVSASFVDDRAYFVGIRELAFLRDRYAVAADNDLYVETMSDLANGLRNDFIDEGFPPKKLGQSTI